LRKEWSLETNPVPVFHTNNSIVAKNPNLLAAKDWGDPRQAALKWMEEA